jgi:hypothetical protein
VRTEFGFDVAQTARLRYAPYVYRQQIGLRVSRPLLERAFFETYGLTVRSILGPPVLVVAKGHDGQPHQGRPLFSECSNTSGLNRAMHILFASPHCALDRSSGATISVTTQLEELASLGWRCLSVTRTVTSGQDPVDRHFASWGVRRLPGTTGRCPRDGSSSPNDHADAIDGVVTPSRACHLWLPKPLDRSF